MQQRGAVQLAGRFSWRYLPAEIQWHEKNRREIPAMINRIPVELPADT